MIKNRVCVPKVIRKFAENALRMAIFSASVTHGGKAPLRSGSQKQSFSLRFERFANDSSDYLKNSLAIITLLAMLVTSMPAMAQLAVTDVKQTVQEKTHFSIKLKFDEVKFKKELLQAAKDFALAELQKKIQEKTGLNLTIGFKNLNKKLDEKMGFVVDTTAAATQAQIAADAAVQDAANLQAQAQDLGKIATGPTEKIQGVSRLCYAVQDAKAVAQGGPAADLQGGGGGGIKDNRGAGPRITFQARSKDTFRRLKEGGKDKNGKSVPSSTLDTAANVNNRANDAQAQAASNTIGSNGAKGPIVYRRDQADAFLTHYISEGSFFGAVKAAGITVKKEAELTAGLDTRAADLLSAGGAQLSLLCLTDAANGKFILDGFDAAFCGKKYNWETAVKEGYQVGTSQKRPMDKIVDLATAYVIRDYIVPPPFSSFTPQFLKALADKKNYGAAEVLAKRQAFNNAASIVAGIYNKRIADITPQVISDDDLKRFAKTWATVYPGTPVPPLPSKKARQDIDAERYRTVEYRQDLANGDVNGIQQATAAGLSVALQKDILYSLERIEVLLATMLSNDLQDRRGAIEQQINAANSATR